MNYQDVALWGLGFVSGILFGFIIITFMQYLFAKMLENGYKLEYVNEDIRDSAQFSNFAQRVKMAYWEKMADGKRVPEIYLDDILLIAWKEFKK